MPTLVSLGLAIGSTVIKSSRFVISLRLEVPLEHERPAKWYLELELIREEMRLVTATPPPTIPVAVALPATVEEDLHKVDMRLLQNPSSVLAEAVQCCHPVLRAGGVFAFLFRCCLFACFSFSVIIHPVIIVFCVYVLLFAF